MAEAPKVHRLKKKQGKIVKKINNIRAYKRQSNRQYKTSSSQWKRIRQQHFNAHPNNNMCAECYRKGMVTINKSMHVDHIDGNAYNNEPNNLQTLCASCHSRKTAKEDGGFGNMKAN